MDTRATIEAILDKAYAARQQQDAQAAAACFTDGRLFRGPMAVRRPPTGPNRRCRNQGPVRGLRAADGFREHCRLIDPPRAVVHWRGTFRAQNGQVGETDILDLIEVRDGKIASLTSFFDTAYAAALSAPADPVNRLRRLRAAEWRRLLP